jgi:hypothetical protein
MLSLLAAIRDYLVALALAWVGVTMERVETNARQAPACAENSQSCAD